MGGDAMRDVVITAQQLGSFTFGVLVAAAVGCIVLVLGAIGAGIWLIRAVYRVFNGRPVFEAERDPDVSDVMLNDYGDVPYLPQAEAGRVV
jgi:hypothetical protein